jgi:hypothetical protein
MNIRWLRVCGFYTLTYIGLDDIHSETFVMASFDNLDKNQNYAMVGAGKDKSGFHGTTIQAVYSKPSEKNLQVELVSAGFEDTPTGVW